MIKYKYNNKFNNTMNRYLIVDFLKKSINDEKQKRVADIIK